MALQETLLTKNRRGPKPTGVGILIGVRIQPNLLTRLDAYRGEDTRPEAIRRLVEQSLETQ